MNYPKEKQITRINTNEDFIDSLIWSSCRYFIGRHTIHASCAAKDLAEFLRDNPKIISPGRRQFLAKDIRERINDNLNWCGNVHIDGQQQVGREDALTLLVRKVIQVLDETGLIYAEDDWRTPIVEGQFNPAKYDWTINLTTGEVIYKLSDHNSISSIGPFCLGSLLSDLVMWQKVASWLDPTHIFDAGSGIQNVPGFYYPAIGRYEGEENLHVELHPVTCEAYIQRPYIDTYLNPDFITQVRTI